LRLALANSVAACLVLLEGWQGDVEELDQL
jgi:hypothetical protein